MLLPGDKSEDKSNADGDQEGGEFLPCHSLDNGRRFVKAEGRSPLRRMFHVASEEGFAAYWKKLLAKDQRLAAYPKSFQAQLREAYVEGFKHGSAERQIEIEAHKNTETFLRREEEGK